MRCGSRSIISRSSSARNARWRAPQSRGIEAQREYVRAIERRLGRVIPWVFVHPDGTQVRDFRYAWAKACRAAAVPGRLVHDLRRTAVRNLERASVPRSAAMKLTGHRTEAVYARYAIVDSAMLEEAAVKLAALHSSPRSERGRKPLANCRGWRASAPRVGSAPCPAASR
jgi:integrase